MTTKGIGKNDVLCDEKKICNEIKSLANEVGLSYEETTLPEEIILALSDEIEAQIDNSEDNPSALSELMELYRRLDKLDEELDNLLSVKAEKVLPDTLSVVVEN